jgi:hypothetical protein
MGGGLKVWAVGVVAVVIVALALTACGGGGDSTGTSGGPGGELSTEPITLPAEIDGFSELVKVIASKDSPPKLEAEQEANQEEVGKATEAAYSKAYGGAAAAYRSYADSKLLKMPYVIAVRAEAPGMTIGPVQSADFLGLAKLQQEVQQVGEVECEVIWSPPPLKGEKIDPSAEIATTCQRTGSGVSVFVGSSGFEGPDGLKSMSSFTEAAWEAVAGD